jgi:hypothetical protein
LEPIGTQNAAKSAFKPDSQRFAKAMSIADKCEQADADLMKDKEIGLKNGKSKLAQKRKK